MTNFEKAVEVIGIAGIVRMMGVYCDEATASTCSDCPWRKAVSTISGCCCITDHDIVQFLGCQYKEMREMEYVNTRVKPYRLADGTYKGFPYYVLSLGAHPCAYVDVSDIPEDELDTNCILCHGGITYSDERLATVDKKGWFIGWDYANCYDYTGMVPDCYAGSLKRWTTREIVEECKKAIDQIVELRKHKG